MSDAAARQFPETRDSLVQALRSTESDARRYAFDLVVRAYRTPAIALLERRWSLSHEEAEDLAHDFFATALEKDWLLRFDANRARFRTFLRSCLFAFATDASDRKHAQKRGGDVRHVSIDDATIAGTIDSGDASMDTLFEQEWIRSVLQMSLDALDAEARDGNHALHVQLFRRYDIDGADLDVRPTYAQLANEFDLPPSQVTNYLTWARRRFRQHVMSTLRALTGSEAEYRAEVHTLLGAHVE